MRKIRLDSVVKGSARLLDIGSNLNRRKTTRTIAAETREVIGRTNRMVSSVLCTNIYNQVKRVRNVKKKQVIVGSRLEAIRTRMAGLGKKVAEYKEKAVYQQRRY